MIQATLNFSSANTKFSIMVNVEMFSECDMGKGESG